MKFIPALFVALAASAPLSAAHQRIYMLGNSLTDDLHYEGFAAIVANGGDTLALGTSRIPGAPIWWLWEHPSDAYVHAPYNHYPNAFANYTWDAVSLQPFSTYSVELAHARYFAQALRGDAGFGPGAPVPGGTPTGISPNAIVYIYAQWPGQMPDTWRSSYWLDNNTNSRGVFFYEQFMTELTAAEPATTFRLIPAGHVFHELYQLTRAGRIPGITRQADFMEDPTHLNNRGSYIPALTFYTVIYGVDPRGMVCPPVYPLTPEQATIVQDAVWKVVKNLPWTGMAEGLVITNPSLPDCVEGQPYSATLTTAQANGAVTWSLAPGSALPPGITLSPSGVISGTTTTPGIYDIIARATDAGGAVAERAYILFALSNNPPVIATTSLPTAAYGAPYNVQLAHTGGVGEVTWSLYKNDLPHGLVLESDGRIHGTPLSIQATFTPTFLVEDSIGSSAQLAIPITIGAPEPGTLISGPTATAPVINGTLDETFWSFPHTANRRLKGEVNNSVTFGIRQDASAFYIGIRVEDTSVQPDEDAVQLFIDGLHDREAVYNADDRHFTIFANGALSERNGRGSGVTAATQIRADGYDVEVRVPFSNLDIEPDGQSVAIGFDLGVLDVDAPAGPQAYQVWLATDHAAPSPATMGNLVLAVGPLANNIIVNSTFDEAMTRLGYPGRATTDVAGQGWQSNGVPSRPFGMIDNLGYGFPTKAIVASGADRISCVYQVISDQRATTGQGVLRFDLKIADSDIAYRIYAYNGDAAQVTAAMGTESQQHPAKGGTPTATLASGTLAGIPISTKWREVAIPVDFGSGYDYYVIAFSSPGGDTVPLDSRIDNIHLGALAAQQSVDVPASTPTLKIEAIQPSGSEAGTPLTFRVTRQTVDATAIPFSLIAGGTATAGADYTLPDSLFIPGRAATFDFAITPLRDQLAEGTESVTLSLASGSAYMIGSPSSAAGTIADHPRDQWYSENISAGAIDWNADPDGDGLSNLLEYALGGDPLAASPTPNPQVALADDVLTLAYLRARADLNYRVETSTDLSAWTTDGVDQDTEAQVGEVAVASVPLGSATPRRFLRLHVEEKN